MSADGIVSIVTVVAVWSAVSIGGALLYHWLRPHIPKRRMVVVVRSGDRDRVVAVAGRQPYMTSDRVVAEIDPDRRIIVLPRRRVATADLGTPVVISGLLRYDIADPDRAAGLSEPIAQALGDGVFAAVDERLRDMPVGRALVSREETGDRLLEALKPLRGYGIVVTDVELTTFTGPDGQMWAAPPVRDL